jgi:hypothetical protein
MVFDNQTNDFERLFFSSQDFFFIKLIMLLPVIRSANFKQAKMESIELAAAILENRLCSYKPANWESRIVGKLSGRCLKTELAE